jgi:hypothetical protein
VGGYLKITIQIARVEWERKKASELLGLITKRTITMELRAKS